MSELEYEVTFKLKDNQEIKASFTADDLALFTDQLAKGMAWLKVLTDDASSTEEGIIMRADNILFIAVKEKE